MNTIVRSLIQAVYLINGDQFMFRNIFGKKVISTMVTTAKNRVVNWAIPGTRSFNSDKVLPERFYQIKDPREQAETFKYLLENKRHFEAHNRKRNFIFFGGLGAVASAAVILGNKSPRESKIDQAQSVTPKPTGRK